MTSPPSSAKAESSRSVLIDGPLDLRRTLRPLHGRFRDDGWWLAGRTPSGAGTLRVRRDQRRVIGEAWGPGADWLLQRLSGIAGLDDHPESFETDHPLVSELHRRHLGMRFGRTDLVFDALVVAICGQKVTGSEAARAMRGLYSKFSDSAPGPDTSIRLPPDPVRMAASPYWDYHEMGLEKRRADVLRRVAAAASEVEALRDGGTREASLRLMSYDGIGEWSVAETLGVSHGDSDAVSVGDFHEKHIVVHHLTGKDRGTDEEMLELLEPFRPHRGRVARLLHTLGHEPKFGPRMAPRDITRM